MNRVQPLRDKAKIEELKQYLRERHGEKYRFLFIAGIYSALRISDLLELRVKDVKQTHLIYTEKKTGNERRIKINAVFRSEINQYIQTMGLSDEDWLFAGEQTKKPISRQYAHRVISDSAKDIGIEDRISPHTLRKTFGWHMYQQTKDVALLQQIFGHAAPSVTLRYIGISDDVIDVAMDSFAI